MVVEYSAGASGSCLSFFTVTPFVLLKCRGSAVPLVFPQILIAIGLSLLAQRLQDTGSNPLHDVDQPVSLGILVTFLLVFKTQSAYGQFWQALSALDGVLQTSASMALTACTIFDWNMPTDTHSEVRTKARRIVRLLVLHFFVLVEYFQRTGANDCTDTHCQNMMREDIRHLTGDVEFAMLYPDEPAGTSGSASKHHYANPTQVLFWIQLAVGRVNKMGACAPPIVGGVIRQVQDLMNEFSVMNKIDKTQFPLPYAQIVKILTIVWVFSLPFFLVSSTGNWTAVISSLAALGYFGLDETAEILESPFGNDPNDIYLRQYGVKLMSDIEMIYNGRDIQLDAVGTHERELNFAELLAGQFKVRPIEGDLKKQWSVRSSSFQGVKASSSSDLDASAAASASAPAASFAKPPTSTPDFISVQPVSA